MSDFQQIGYRLEDRVVTITLERPAARNAFTLRMAYELREAFEQADADDEARVVVLTGTGQDFCVGADLSGEGFHAREAGAEDLPASNLEPAGSVSSRIFRMNKPVIAALNGAAVGVGATIPLAADFRLAATDSRFAFPFTRRGIVAEGGSTWFLPRLVGLPRALDWAITGRTFGAEEAMNAGLLHSVHTPEALPEAAGALAREIAARTAPVAVAVTRQMIYRMSALDSPGQAHQLETQLVDHLLRGPDATEGVASFIEKRPANFPGRVSNDLPAFLPWVGSQ